MRPYQPPYDQQVYGGMNDIPDDLLVSRYEGKLVQNGIIRNSGAFSGRLGLTLLGDDTGNTRVMGLGIQRQTPSFITRIVNGASVSKVQLLATNAWGDITSATLTKDVDVFPYPCSNGSLYYPTQGVDCGKFDGTTWTTVAAIPRGKFGCEWKNFIWNSGNATYPRRLYFSNIGTPETYTGSDYVDFPEEITCIKPYFNRLVIGMKHGVAYIAGGGQSDFIVTGQTIYTPTSFDFGIASQESAQVVGNELWAMDEEGNVRRLFRSSTDDIFGGIVSDKIQTLTATFNKSQLAKVTAAAVNGYYIFYAPTGSGTENSVGAYFDTKASLPNGVSAWVKHTGWKPSHFGVYDISGAPTLIVGENTADQKTYTWAGTSDNGTAIEMIWKGGKNVCKLPNQFKLFKWGKIEFKPIGNYTGKILADINATGLNDIKTVSFLGDNKQLGVNWTLGVDALGNRGRLTETFNFIDGGADNAGNHVQIELYASYISAVPEWYDMIFMYKALRLR